MSELSAARSELPPAYCLEGSQALYNAKGEEIRDCDVTDLHLKYRVIHVDKQGTLHGSAPSPSTRSSSCSAEDLPAALAKHLMLSASEAEEQLDHTPYKKEHVSPQSHQQKAVHMASPAPSGSPMATSGDESGTSCEVTPSTSAPAPNSGSQKGYKGTPHPCTGLVCGPGSREVVPVSSLESRSAGPYAGAGKERPQKQAQPKQKPGVPKAERRPFSTKNSSGLPRAPAKATSKAPKPERATAKEQPKGSRSPAKPKAEQAARATQVVTRSMINEKQREDNWEKLGPGA